MNWRSVRVRLTGLVVAVAALAMLAAATFGVSQIRESLVADVVDDATAQTLFLDGFGFDEGFSIEEILFEEVPFDADADGVFVEQFDFVVEEMDDLVAELDGVGAVDVLLDEMGRSRDQGLPVLHGFGIVVLVGLDGAPSTISSADSVEIVGPVAFEFNLYDLVSAAFQVDSAELLSLAAVNEQFDEESFEDLIEQRVDDAAAALEFETGSAEIAGVEFVVVADVSDVTRSVDKIRSVLWVTMPVLIVVAAVATWFLTGRALSPVRRMTRQVGVISGGTLHERVPVPGTGDEIQELGSTMNAMLDRLEADDQRLRQFVSDASHELRSPVAVLRSEAEVALRAGSAVETGELAEGVLGESLRLERIVADLLVLARGDEARAPVSSTAIDLDDVVLAEAARRRGVSVDVGAVSAGRVRGTREGCERVLVHLLDNAARHAETAVTVGLATAGGTVTLTVDDDGPGIPEADRARIFERFTRLEAARTRDTGGAGLGLAVVAATVASMGGTVAVDDAPLGGARFVVTFPAAS